MIEPTKSLISSYLDPIFKVLLKARTEVLAVYESIDPGTEFKQDRSPVTHADIRSHQVIIDSLWETPWPILSEEGSEVEFLARIKWETYWLIDPLDGTKEFLNRNGEFTINIALIHQHYPIAGWVYAPVENVLWVGFRPWLLKFQEASQVSENLWKDGSWMAYAVPVKPYGGEDIRIAVSRSHIEDRTQRFIHECNGIFGDVATLRRGSSIKFCMVAEGTADIYPRFGPTMEWDTAAGQAVVEASGGKVLALETAQRLAYNLKPDLTNPPFLVIREGFPIKKLPLMP